MIFIFCMIMFPSIQVAWATLYMTGLGIIIWLLVFIISMWHYTRHYGLSFGQFFQTLGLLIVIPYLLGGWSYIMIEHNILYPTNMQDLINIITPFEYKFHFIWVLVWLLIYMIWFIRYYADNANTKKRRIDAFVNSVCIACIPLWFFLLLGDDFIGKENQYGIFSVASLTANSELSKYVKVYPLGLWLSLIWLTWWLLMSMLKYMTKRSGQGLLWLSYVFSALSMLFVFQIYPRHGVWTISNGIILDIKNYICIIVALVSLFLYVWSYRKPHKIS